MSIRHSVLPAIFLCFGCGLAWAQGMPASAAQTPAHLDAVLAQMDKASAQFRTARADFTSDYYQAVVKETTSQNGPIFFERTKTGTEMGAVFMSDGKKRNVVEYRDAVLRYYDVANNQVRTLKAGPNQAQYESFLTLGFGGSGHDLARAWNIADLGEEKLMDSGKPVAVEKLELTSKDPAVQKLFTRVTLWVDTARDVSLKQVFETPSHDRRTASYSHIRVNVKIDKGTFEIDAKAVKVN